MYKFHFNDKKIDALYFVVVIIFLYT